MTEQQKADRAVARGIRWLNAHVPKWRDSIDLGSLNLLYPCDCVLGQLDGNFYEAVWKYGLPKDKVKAMGFAASAGLPYRTLTAAWQRALKDPA